MPITYYCVPAAQLSADGGHFPTLDIGVPVRLCVPIGTQWLVADLFFDLLASDSCVWSAICSSAVVGASDTLRPLAI